MSIIAFGVVLDMYRMRRRPLVRPDERGLLPVVRAEIETGQLADTFTGALAAFHTTQLAQAQRPIVDKVSISVKEAGWSARWQSGYFLFAC